MVGLRPLLILLPIALTACPGSEETESSFDEFVARCEAQIDEASCSTVEGFEGDGVGEPQSGFCVWETSATVSVVENGSCVIGQPSGRCVVDTASSEGCASPSVQCGSVAGAGIFGGLREGEDDEHLVQGQFCLGVPDAQQCVVNEGIPSDDSPPECACFCDPAWTG